MGMGLFLEDKNILKLIGVNVAQPYEYNKSLKCGFQCVINCYFLKRHRRKWKKDMSRYFTK